MMALTTSNCVDLNGLSSDTMISLTMISPPPDLLGLWGQLQVAAQQLVVLTAEGGENLKKTSFNGMPFDVGAKVQKRSETLLLTRTTD